MPMTFVSLVYLLLVYNIYCQFVINSVLHILELLMYVNLYACFVTNYLPVIINSSMKTSSDVVRQKRKFYAQANMLRRNFRYCNNNVKCTLFKSFCANMHCCTLWFNSTSSTIKKLKTNYNGALRILLLIKKPYSASTMFATHGIPSICKLLCTSIYRFADHVSKN